MAEGSNSRCSQSSLHEDRQLSRSSTRSHVSVRLPASDKAHRLDRLASGQAAWVKNHAGNYIVGIIQQVIVAEMYRDFDVIVCG